MQDVSNSEQTVKQNLFMLGAEQPVFPEISSPDCCGLLGADTMAIFAFFVRRQNQNSSVDSVFTVCFQTIVAGCAETDPRLRSAEQKHTCNPQGEFNYPHWHEVSRVA